MEWKALPDVGRGFGKKTTRLAQSAFAPRAEWLGISDGGRIEFARNAGGTGEMSNAEKSDAKSFYGYI